MSVGPEELEQLRRSLVMSPSLPASEAQRLLDECLRLQGRLDEVMRRIDAAIEALRGSAVEPPP